MRSTGTSMPWHERTASSCCTSAAAMTSVTIDELVVAVLDILGKVVRSQVH
jgi:hypothetical protein